MVTYTAATAYVRLKRESVNDAQPVIELLKFGSLSVANGAQLVLALDQMRPDVGSIKEILILSKTDIKTTRWDLAMDACSWQLPVPTGTLT